MSARRRRRAAVRGLRLGAIPQTQQRSVICRRKHGQVNVPLWLQRRHSGKSKISCGLEAASAHRAPATGLCPECASVRAEASGRSHTNELIRSRQSDRAGGPRLVTRDGFIRCHVYLLNTVHAPARTGSAGCVPCTLKCAALINVIFSISCFRR